MATSHHSLELGIFMFVSSLILLGRKIQQSCVYNQFCTCSFGLFWKLGLVLTLAFYFDWDSDLILVVVNCRDWNWIQQSLLNKSSKKKPCPNNRAISYFPSSLESIKAQILSMFSLQEQNVVGIIPKKLQLKSLVKRIMNPLEIKLIVDTDEYCSRQFLSRRCRIRRKRKCKRGVHLLWWCNYHQIKDTIIMTKPLQELLRLYNIYYFI